jgi:hypothetical protein
MQIPASYSKTEELPSALRKSYCEQDLNRRIRSFFLVPRGPQPGLDEYRQGIDILSCPVSLGDNRVDSRLRTARMTGSRARNVSGQEWEVIRAEGPAVRPAKGEALVYRSHHVFYSAVLRCSAQRAKSSPD